MHGSPNPAAQNQRIRENLSRIQHIVMVMSGKGGVGKSTVSTNLAFSLALRGFKVGIMDVDIHGPNVPKMLGIEDRQFGGTDEAIEPVQVLENLWAASIGLVGYDPDQALIWRGPIKVGLIKQFLGDVVWGDLDYLIIDTPPGTGDETLTVAQIIPTMAGAIVVTSPQDVSILDSRKSINFAVKLNLPVLGVVENMSGFVCPNCGTITEIFKSGGGERAAEELVVPFLGKIPLEPHIVAAGDAGTPYIATHPESVTAQAFAKVIDNMEKQIELYKSQGLYDKAQRELENVFERKTVKGVENFKPER
ncbi:MAG: Mrp/NBP35 family ATP-binding protein [Spirochaetales bacterium]|nr:Mrp/NBP35 family ATP-binding protein [Spirochaetales bacterium]